MHSSSGQDENCSQFKRNLVSHCDFTVFSHYTIHSGKSGHVILKIHRLTLSMDSGNIIVL